MGAIFKLYFEAKEESLDSNCMLRLTHILSSIGDIQTSEIKRYWKIPEYLEIVFSLKNVSDTDKIASSFLDTFGSSWEKNQGFGEIAFIWNQKREQRSHFDSRIRWMNLELFL
ncbi:MAG: hypothetical protein KA436_11735 [Oligoflexales bacterium]|nr:hypothetical protein [Oligoflexales bacterium]